MDAEVKDPSSGEADIPAKGLQVKPEHKAEWVRRFHESGSTYAKFSAIYGLRVATLRSWVEKEWEARQRTSTPEFTEIKLPEVAPERPSWSAEVTFANGNRLRMCGDIPPVVIERLLRVC